MRHHHIEANGVTIHAVELGEGPAVLFCHGFPDTWRSWRRQTEAVAATGRKAIAIDMRGFGQSSAPQEAERYTPFYTVGDFIAVLDALSVDQATIVGHDFGAHAAWHAAMMRPDRFNAVFGISVPFRPRGDKSLLDRMREACHDGYYMFSQIRPEADAEWADAAKTIPAVLWWTSAMPPEDERWSPLEPARSLTRPAPVPCPPWANREDVKATIADFERTGFHGGLNYYRMVQPFFEASSAFKGASVHQPSYYIIGRQDGLNDVGPVHSKEELVSALPGVRGFQFIENAGHWPHLEQTEATNAALLDFLRGV